MNILTEDGKSLPQGESLKRKYNLYIGFRRNISDQREVAAKFLFFYNIYLTNIEYPEDIFLIED